MVALSPEQQRIKSALDGAGIHTSVQANETDAALYASVCTNPSLHHTVPASLFSLHVEQPFHSLFLLNPLPPGRYIGASVMFLYQWPQEETSLIPYALSEAQEHAASLLHRTADLSFFPSPVDPWVLCMRMFMPLQEDEHIEQGALELHTLLEKSAQTAYRIFEWFNSDEESKPI